MVEGHTNVLPVADRERYDALHDPETGLPGWALVLDRTQVALARARRIKLTVAIFAIEDLRPVGGEELDLRALAEALRAGLRPDDTIARVGQRAFIAVCNDIRRVEDAPLVAHRLVAKAGVQCLLGIALGFGDEDATELLGAALDQMTRLSPPA